MPPPKLEGQVTSCAPSHTPMVDTSNYFIHKNGRRFLREVPNYPLPVDLAELHRQSLRTNLLLDVLGSPFCAKLHKPPENILEMICGPAVWSLKCDRYLKQMGCHNVRFTGLDVAPLAPDLTRFGLNWQIIQHDLRKPPMPFKEGEFDLIMVSNGTAVTPCGKDVRNSPITALKKYLRPGGCVEVLETDYVFQCLQAEPTTPPGSDPGDARQAKETATYIVGPATPFSKTQNQYLADYNRWIENTLQEGLIGYGLSAEAFGYEQVGSRRVAIPLSAIRWENDVDTESLVPFEALDNPKKGTMSGRGKGLTTSVVPVKEYKPLTARQAALRQTALSIAVGLIRSLELVLMRESGKKQDEWDRWWGAMMADLLETNGAFRGECLGAGVWWARKASIQQE